MQAEPSFAVHNLTKRFGRHTVLDNAELSINKGEVVAITGYPGCGKSTLLKIILSCQSFDSGKVQLFPQRHGPAFTIGYQPQEIALPAHISPLFFLEACAIASGISRSRARFVAGEMVDAIDIGGKGRQPCQRLTLLEKRLVSVAQATIGAPDLLFLDEPTGGLGGQGASFVIDAIAQLLVEGQTVIITARSATGLETICSRWLTLAHGKVTESSAPSPGSASGATVGDSIRVQLDDLPADMAGALSEIGWSVDLEYQTLILDDATAEKEREFLSIILDSGLRITRWEHITPPNPLSQGQN